MARSARSIWRLGLAAGLAVTAAGGLAACDRLGAGTQPVHGGSAGDDDTTRPVSDEDRLREELGDEYGTFEPVEVTGFGSQRIELDPEVRRAEFGAVLLDVEGASDWPRVSGMDSDGFVSTTFIGPDIPHYRTGEGEYVAVSAWTPVNQAPYQLIVAAPGKWTLEVLPADELEVLPQTEAGATSGDASRLLIYGGAGERFFGTTEASGTPDALPLGVQTLAPGDDMMQRLDLNRDDSGAFSGVLPRGPVIVLVSHNDDWTLQLDDE